MTIAEGRRVSKELVTFNLFSLEHLLKKLCKRRWITLTLKKLELFWTLRNVDFNGALKYVIHSLILCKPDNLSLQQKMYPRDYPGLGRIRLRVCLFDKDGKPVNDQIKNSM